MRRMRRAAVRVQARASSFWMARGSGCCEEYGCGRGLGVALGVGLGVDVPLGVEVGGGGKWGRMGSRGDER